MMNRVRLYFIRSQAEKKRVETINSLQEQWLCELSLQKQASVQRLINERDRQSSLFGLGLLKMTLQDEGIADFKLSDIQFPESGKPYCNRESIQQFDFNISHSGDLILVAMSKTLKVGVDAEKIRRLNNLNFKMVMTADELIQIQQTPGLFFDLWSKKEAVVKAANTAGIARMRDVFLAGKQAMLDEICWYIMPLNKQMKLEKEFSVHLATSQPVHELVLKNLTIDDFI